MSKVDSIDSQALPAPWKARGLFPGLKRRHVIGDSVIGGVEGEKQRRMNLYSIPQPSNRNHSCFEDLFYFHKHV